MTVEYRSMRLNEMDECLDLWNKAFSGTSREFFKAYFEADPYFRPEYTRVCAVDGRLVSAVQICERSVHAGKSVLTMGGIANVGTDPEYCGHGYSSNVLRDCRNAMHEAGMDFSILFTGINPFYERVGWRTVPHKFIVGEMVGSVPELETAALRQCRWEEDLDALIQIYNEFNQRRSLTNHRSSEYWRSWVARRSNNGASIKVLELDGQIEGYIQASYDDQNCWLNEIGYHADRGYARDLIISAAKEAYSAGARRIWSRLPDQSDIRTSLNEIMSKQEESYSGGDMYCLINVPSIFDKIRAELEMRLSEANLCSCKLTVETDDGSYSTDICGSAGGNAVELTVDTVEFVKLLFGFDDRDEKCCAHYIDSLFPVNPSVIWSVDHF
jgi:predicted acetyltransferase